MFLNKFKLDWKYAIGEIFLIAVGVLLALAVDGWRDYRADRALESEYVKRIENDLRSSLDTWDSHEARRESAIEFLERMRRCDLDVIESGNAADVWNDYMVSQWFAPPAIRSSAFEELVSTGRLSIIENLNLRDSISTFYTEYFSVAEMAAQMADHSYTKFSRSHFPWEIYKAWSVSGDADPATLRDSFEALCSKPEFKELSNAQLASHVSTIQFISIFRDFAKDLLNEISAHQTQ